MDACIQFDEVFRISGARSAEKSVYHMGKNTLRFDISIVKGDE